MIPDGVLAALIREAHGEGQSLAAWGVAWARALPTVILVPAFGLGILPAALRIAVGFVLAVAVAPALRAPVLPEGVPWLLALVGEAIRGIPTALTASTALFAATVAGGVSDVAAGTSRLRTGSGIIGERAPLATLLGLLACASFLEFGGATRVAARLSATPEGGALARAVFDLATGLEVGAALGAPVLLAALVVDVAGGIAARELPTLRSDTVVAPLRSLVVLVLVAALFDRTAAAITGFEASRP